MEVCIENIVSYFKHAAQGLEEHKQILYLLGPVGAGKSSLIEAMRRGLEKVESFFAIEEPLQSGDYDGMRRLAQTLDTAIILDESFQRADQFALSVIENLR